MSNDSFEKHLKDSFKDFEFKVEEDWFNAIKQKNKAKNQQKLIFKISIISLLAILFIGTIFIFSNSNNRPMAKTILAKNKVLIENNKTYSDDKLKNTATKNNKTYKSLKLVESKTVQKKSKRYLQNKLTTKQSSTNNLKSSIKVGDYEPKLTENKQIQPAAVNKEIYDSDNNQTKLTNAEQAVQVIEEINSNSIKISAKNDSTSLNDSLTLLSNYFNNKAIDGINYKNTLYFGYGFSINSGFQSLNKFSRISINNQIDTNNKINDVNQINIGYGRKFSNQLSFITTLNIQQIKFARIVKSTSLNNAYNFNTTQITEEEIDELNLLSKSFDISITHLVFMSGIKYQYDFNRFTLVAQGGPFISTLLNANGLMVLETEEIIEANITNEPKYNRFLFGVHTGLGINYNYNKHIYFGINASYQTYLNNHYKVNFNTVPNPHLLMLNIASGVNF